MLSLAFDAADVARTRFAVSSVSEAVLSVRVLKDPKFQLIARPWLKDVRTRLGTTPPPALRILWDLVPSGGGRIPDFATPPPTGPTPDLDRELRELTATEPHQVQADLDDVGLSDSPALRTLRDSPRRGLAELATAIEQYWHLALAAHWARIHSALQADIVYRAQQIAEGGAELLFASLHPVVSWSGTSMQIAHRPYSHHRSAGGRGLLLVPSAFTWPYAFTVTADPWQPTLIYPVRAVATIWEHEAAPGTSALDRVLGRTRARLLIALDTPTTTTDLALRTALTTGGVSQHLTALRAGGLAISVRHGRQVFYSRTPIADAMIDACRSH